MRHAAALKWTVAQGLLDYRRRNAAELTLADRAQWLHVWSARLLDRLGVERRVLGPIPTAGIVVSNHLSYLDIPIFSADMPCVFVSKSEVRSWPLFGMITTMAGTVYVDRKRKADTRNANDGIRNALRQGLRVVIFPEGTSSDGSGVLPFFPSLLEPAMETSAPITAAHLRYQVKEGSVGRDLAYWGDMTFFPHLLKLLSLNGISSEVRFAETAKRFADRKVAAAELREEVVRLAGTGLHKS